MYFNSLNAQNGNSELINIRIRRQNNIKVTAKFIAHSNIQQ
jgi:hypothetical protein